MFSYFTTRSLTRTSAYILCVCAFTPHTFCANSSRPSHFSESFFQINKEKEESRSLPVYHQHWAKQTWDDWVITATSGRVKQASEIWMICQFISQKCHNFLRWSRSRVFWPPYKTRDFLLLLSAYLRQSRTLHIFDGLELPGQFLSALTGQGSLFVLGQFLQSVAVVSQIHLSPDQQEGRPRAVVRDLRHPLWRSKAKRRVRRWGTNTWPAESHSSIHFCWIQTSFSDTQCSITFNCWLYASKT